MSKNGIRCLQNPKKFLLFCREDQAATWLQVSSIRSLPSCNRHIPWIQVCFPCTPWSCHYYLPQTNTAIFTILVSHPTVLWTRNFPRNKKKQSSEWMPMEFSDFYHVPYCPEAAGLKEGWTGLLKTQLQQQLREHCGSGLLSCRVLQFLHKQNSWGRMAALTIISKFHLWIFYFSIPQMCALLV